MIKIDDILAALVLSLVMFRRLDIKTARLDQNPHVALGDFERWRDLALRGYDRAALASAAKVVLNVGWYNGAMALRIGAPWFQLVGLVVFLGWVVSLVWAWKIATDARHLRVSLGIRLRRQLPAAREKSGAGAR
jgi:hypothetical protein